MGAVWRWDVDGHTYAVPLNDYRFTTHWRVPGTVREVADILADAEGLTRWWPSVYLDVRELASGDARGVGKEVALHTKGWLPYTLRWRFRVTEVDYPHGFSIQALGDFVGTGVWTLTQDGEHAHVNYDWRIRAEKPLLRFFSPILRPIFELNHRWAMDQGERSLRAELERRRGAGPVATGRGDSGRASLAERTAPAAAVEGVDGDARGT